MNHSALRPGGPLDELANLAAQVSFAPAAVVLVGEASGWVLAVAASAPIARW